jgi:hypothetical protein
MADVDSLAGSQPGDRVRVSTFDEPGGSHRLAPRMSIEGATTRTRIEAALRLGSIFCVSGHSSTNPSQTRIRLVPTYMNRT